MLCRIKNLHRLSFIVWSSVAFVGLGVGLSILGPTLLDLAAHLSVGVTALSSMFTVRAMGAVTGSIVSGVLLDKLSHYSYAIVSATLLVSIITLCIVPYSIHLVMMGVFIFICGISLGSLDNGCNTVLLRLWRTGSGPSMQLLHFSFGVGALLAPLLAEPFISSIAGDLGANVTCHEINMTTSDVFDISCLLALFNESCSGNHSNHTFSASNCSHVPTQSGSLRFAYAYLLGAVPFIFPLVAFTYHSARSEFGHCYQRKESLQDSAVGTDLPHEEKSHHLLEKPHLLFKVVFFPCLFLFICLYCGMETSYGNLIFTFAVESLNFSKQKAALLNAVFWGCFTVGRFVAIFIAYTKVPSSVVIAVDTIGSTMSLLVMVALPGNDIAVWVGSAGLGVFMASIYPTAMFWLSEQVEVSGKAVAVITTGATLGDMTLPLTAGALIAQLSPSALMPFAFVGTALYTLVGGVLMLIAFIERRRRRRKSCAGVGYRVLEDSEPGEELTSDLNSVPQSSSVPEDIALSPDQAHSNTSNPDQAHSNTSNPDQAHSNTFDSDQAHSITSNPDQAHSNTSIPDQAHSSTPDPDKTHSNALNLDQAHSAISPYM